MPVCIVGREYHDMQVGFYADFDYAGLLPFLERSKYYSPELASSICEKKEYWNELVYLMGQMGNRQQALNLLINQLRNVKKAIEFVRTQGDDQLWDDLIDCSMTDSQYVFELLEHIRGEVNPARIIEKIPDAMQIPNLRDRLRKIIADYNLQVCCTRSSNTTAVAV
jgi:vacuolar protein sorting-associated protein 41